MGSTQRALHHLVVPVTLALLLTSFVLTSGPAPAQSLTLCYDGAGVYPIHCSINSQRWFRVLCDRGADTTMLLSLTLSGDLQGGPFNPSLTLFPKPRTDYLDGVCTYPVPGNSHALYWTIGPFTGVAYFPIPAPHASWCMGNFFQNDVYNEFQFHGVFWPENATQPTYADSAVGHFWTSRDDSDTLEWYQSPAAGVDPLTVTANQPEPDNDNGAGDMTYTFRVQYANGRLPQDPNNNQPPRWGADMTVPGPRASYVNFDLLPEAAPTAADAGWAWPPLDYEVPSDISFGYPWTFSIGDDWWLDQTGDLGGYAIGHGVPLAGFLAYEARVRPEVALIIDGNLNSPHFMLREDVNDSEFADGVIYRYVIRPTDYMNFLDPLFQFRYDQAGPDTQDIYTTGVHGTPTSNGYEALNVGRHSYEFWASDDFHPPRGVPHVQVGWPGNQSRVDYIHPRPYLRWWTAGTTSYWWERNLSEGYTIEINPFGYPYDSMQHPDVNPVLSAFPHFPQGSVGEGNVAPWSIVGGEPRLVPNIQYELFNSGTKLYDLYDVVSPFEKYMGPGAGPEGPGSPPGGRPRQPTHYTNDDTIRPNLANIWDATGPTPFAGGKWTTSTQFTFLVNYWRKPSQSPSYIRTMIRKNNRGTAPTQWTGYTMQQVDPSDTDYSDGAVFRFQATPNQLPGNGGAGDYNYRFVASDGTRTTLFPNRPPLWTDSITGGQTLDWDPLLPGDPYQATGIPQSDMGVPVDPQGDNDYYTFRVNNAPLLSDNDVTPASGRVGDNFVYHVTYADVDGQLLNPAARGDEPYKALIWIDLFGDPQGDNHVSSVSSGRLNYTTATGIGYPAGSLVDPNNRYLVRIEEAANQKVVGYQYEITANDTTSITATPVTASGARGLGIDPITPGDRFEILQWFRGTMSKENPADNVATDGILYRFDTANLITLLEGTHRYYFEFWDDWGDWVYPDNPDVSVEGERVRFPQTSEFAGPEVMKNTAPELANYRFTPDAPGTGSDGTTATPFKFFVTYTDHENDPPALIRLGIDGDATTPATVLDMVPSDSNDIVYTDGAVFETPTIQLEAGTHIFRAQATDGELSYPPRANPNDPLLFSGPPNPGGSPPRYDSWPGPNVAQNTPPQLLFPTGDAPPAAPSPGLEPDAGTHLTTFTYTIIYKDTDVYAGVQGNIPAWVRVYIDGGVHDMQPVDPTDTNYTDGATYQFQISDLVAGTAHSYYFLTNDGRDNARKPPFTSGDKQYTGPRVDEPPGPPKTLVVADVADDQGGAVHGNFNPSNDDGGGAGDVTEYRVYRSLASTMANPVLALKKVANGAGSYEFVDNADSLIPPPANTDLWYVVRAWDGTSESTDSNVAGPVQGLDNIAPAPPTNLAVTNPGLGRQLNLSWTKSSDDGAGADDVTEYHLYRASTSGGYTAMLASVPAGSTSYTDTTVTDGTSYFYVARAYDGINESVNSNEAGPIQSTDNQPPILSDLDPNPGARNVPVDTTIAFSATDSGAGVDVQSLVFTPTVGGTAVQGNTEQTPITNGYRFVFTPSAPFHQLDVVQVHIEVSDLAVPTPRTVTKDYRFTINPPPTYTISGMIKVDNGQGPTDPLEGVTVYAGALSGVTDATGAYTINGLTNGSYEVRAEKRGYAFEPPTTNVTIQDAPVPGIDFTAVTGYDISGRVTTHDRGLEGVRVTNDLKEAVTNASGRYTIKDSPEGTYTVRPSYPGDVFTPTERIVILTQAGGSVADVNFEAGPETFTIQGTVRTPDGRRLADVLVTAVRDGRRRASAHTDPEGTYTLSELPAGTYTVSASKPGFSFEPEPPPEVTVGPDSINNDFLAYERFTQAYPAGLSLLAVPVAPRSPDIVAALGTNNIARWDPNRAGAVKYVLASVDPSNPILQLAPGRGYFVSFAAPTTVHVSGTAVRATDTFQFELQSQFNMAGNPYPVDLPWSCLAISPTGPVADFGFLLVPGTRNYELVTDIPELNARTKIPRGAGFWLHSDGATILMSNAPSAMAAAQRTRAPKIDANNWVIPVIAGAPGTSDLSSRAGILAAARANPGRFQVANPPAAQGTVDVYFTNPDGDRLACDIRPARGAENVWQFAVSTDLQNTPITVGLPDLSQVPANLRVTLVDVATGERLYARTMGAHTYNSGQGGERLFRLEITPERGGNLVIQGATAQPLRTAVTVSYILSMRAAISVEIRNISGVRIATVLRGQDAEAGRNQATWNLLSDAGTKVPAGAYLVVLDAVASDGQRCRALQGVHVGG